MLTAYENFFRVFYVFVVCKFCTSKRFVGYFFLNLARWVFVEVVVRDWHKTKIWLESFRRPRKEPCLPCVSCFQFLFCENVAKNHSCMKSGTVLISSLWYIKTVQIIHLQMTWRTTSAWSVPLNRKKIPKCPLRQSQSRSYAHTINRLGVTVPDMEPLYFWASCKCRDFSIKSALKELGS